MVLDSEEKFDYYVDEHGMSVSEPVYVTLLLNQCSPPTWESIVRRGLQLVRKRRLWGVFGGYLKEIKKRGLAE